MQYLFWHLIFSSSIFMASSAIDVTKHPNWKLLGHKKCGTSSSDRIIGGKNARLGAYPWIARIGYYDPNSGNELSYKCGGSLINKFYIVTAAHCVTGLPKGITIGGVRLGEHNTETDPDCEQGYCAEPVQDILVAKVIYHEDYDNPLFRNDIALIRLKKPAKYNDFVKPICLMSGHLLKKSFVGEIAEVAGWGIYDINDPKPSVILQVVKMPIVDTDRCKHAFWKYADIGSQQLCVGGIIGQDSCGGDSGGPLMKVENEEGPPRYYLIGVVSFGAERCGDSATPAVYSNIKKYIIWILDNMSP